MTEREGDAAPIPDLAELLAVLEKALPGLRAISKKLSKVARKGHTDPGIASMGLVELAGRLEELTVSIPKVRELSGVFRDQADRQLLEFEADFREACRVKGWRVDGQWPTLYLERAISVEVDQKKNCATIGEKRVSNPSVQKLLAELEIQAADLIPKAFSPSSFMKALAQAYDSLSGGAGAQVPIWELYRAFVIVSQSQRFWRDSRRANFSGVGVDQFRAQLTKALESGLTQSADGRELRLLPPLNPKEAIFIFQPGESRFGFVGRVELVSALGLK